MERITRAIEDLAAAMEAAGMPHDAAQEFRSELTKEAIDKLAPYRRAIVAAMNLHRGWEVVAERAGCSRRNAYYLAAKGRAILRVTDCTEA